MSTLGIRPPLPVEDRKAEDVLSAHAKETEANALEAASHDRREMIKRTWGLVEKLEPGHDREEALQAIKQAEAEIERLDNRVSILRGWLEEGEKTGSGERHIRWEASSASHLCHKL